MSLLVAVFNEKSDWPGKAITYEDAQHQFILQDRGAIAAQALVGYDAQGQLEWADEGLRQWTQRAAQAAAAEAAAAQAAAVAAEPLPLPGEPDAATSCAECGAPGSEAARLSPAPGTPPSAKALTPPRGAPSPSSSQPPVSARLTDKLSHTMAGAVKAESLDSGPTPASRDTTADTKGSRPTRPRPTSASQAALAEAGFVCSLFGLGVPLLGVLGLMLSMAARRQAQRLGMAKGLPTAGIVIGVIGTVVGLLLLVVALVG